MTTTIAQVGDARTLRATFTSSGVPVDPTTITVKIMAPSGTISTYTFAGGDITKVQTGVYDYVLSITSSGKWKYKWFGTGTAQAASEDRTIDVQETMF